MLRISGLSALQMTKIILLFLGILFNSGSLTKMKSKSYAYQKAIRIYWTSWKFISRCTRTNTAKLNVIIDFAGHIKFKAKQAVSTKNKAFR